MSSAKWYTGDTREVLATLPDGSVDLVMTSPPFLALRSYLPADHPDKAKEIGAEPNPGEFLDVLLDVTEELARVLAPHGSICVELGDTYAGSGGRGEASTDWSDRQYQGQSNAKEGTASRAQWGDGWPSLAKSLCMIPSTYAWALAYGRNPWTGRETDPWRVRNVIRWCRPNPPVGALGDKFRPATSEMTVACKSGKRYFDLDAVREPHKHGEAVARGSYSHGPTGNRRPGGDDQFGDAVRDIALNFAGAPPLDWWEIPTHPYVTPNGTIHVPAEGTFHQVRVPVDARGDGIRRTTSPDCPVHGSSGHPGSTPECGGRVAGESSRTEHTDGRPAPARDGELPPTPSSSDPSSLFGDHDDLAATPHSTASRRTGRAPATTPAGTPSAGSPARTGDTSASPESSAPHPGTDGNRTSPAGSDGAPQGTSDRTAGSPVALSDEACTCSYWVEVSVAAQSTSDYATFPPDYWNIPTYGFPGSHYATFPPELCVRPIKAMCPQRVCRVCGKPSERIVETETRHLNGLKPPGGGRDGNVAGLGAVGHANSTMRVAATLGWTDCGCSPDASHWRNGVVLDPFAGSGTTGAVATGNGRDAVLIDLDPRNFDLARERIGMFLEAA